MAPRSTFSFSAIRVLTASGFFLAAIFFAVIGFASDSGSGWSIVPSPNIPHQSTEYADTYVRGIACTSASQCWAVGNYMPYGLALPGSLIEQWNGSSWSILTTPALDSFAPRLQSVTCLSVSDCWAVGWYWRSYPSSMQTFASHWDGSMWSVVPSSNTSDSEDNLLFGVACSSTSDCWAVGKFPYGTLIEHWDGTAWVIVTSPNPGVSNVLNDVTCVSGSDCWAAGQYFDTVYPGIYKTLLEHWDGSSWNVVSSLNGDSSQYTEGTLTGITCVSSTDCWTVGSQGNTVVEHWDGTSWSVVATPATTPVAQLQRVTCASTSDCWIVGNLGRHTLAEHWNGSAWSIATSPDADSTQTNVLYAVTCLTGTNCWAAGQYQYFQGNVYQTLMEHWDGNAWTLVPAESPNKTVYNVQENELQGVSCVSDTDCWAVGFVQDYSIGYVTLIEHWDGNQWTIVDSPNTSSWDNELVAVTCNSASDCWAVGHTEGGIQALIEHWDGSAWAIVSSAAANSSSLFNVTCTNSTNCWTVGYGNVTGTAGQTLIEHWDGASWTIVASPSASSTTINLLTGVACASASRCWAVGFLEGSGVPPEILMIEWNGSSWEIIAGAYSGGTASLTAATCTSATDCWAIGNYWDGTTSQMLFEHFDGASWSLIPGTSNSSTQQYPQNISCPAPDNCWVAGYQNKDNGPYRPLIANWDGVSWAEVPDPNPSTTESHVLNSISCSSLSECMAVGYDSSIQNTPQTLTELYTPPGVPTYTISVNPSPLNAGTTDGGGRYTSGFETTVTTTPASGYNFHNWVENGLIVSSSPTYSFTVESDRSLFANFVALTATPVISPAGGTFKKKANFKLSCATPGATIYYTTDGSDPTTASSVYPTSSSRKFKGILITGKGFHTVKAMATAPTYDPSQIAIGTFTIN